MIHKKILTAWSLCCTLLATSFCTSCQKEENYSFSPEVPETPATALSIDTSKDSQLNIRQESDSTYILTGKTGNTDPYFFSNDLEETVPEECCVLEFEYTLKEEIDNFELFFIDTKGAPDPARSSSFGTVKPSDEWATYSIRLKKLRKKFNWGFNGEKLRIDIGGTDRTDMKIRNMKLRVMNAEEIKAEEEEDNAENEKQKYEQAIVDYLNTSYDSHITQVSVKSDQITVSGNFTGEGTYFLAEIPPFMDLFAVTKIEDVYKTPLSDKAFTQTLPRKGTIEGQEYDRLLSRWAIFKEGTERDERVSHARYADEIAAVRHMEPLNPAGKKGLGGIINSEHLESDIRDLGITSATINICPVLFMHSTPQADDIVHVYNGKEYYFSKSFLEANLDAPLKVAAKYHVAVAGILLIHPTTAAGADPEIARILQHPDYNAQGVYTMPNLTNITSVEYYAAILDFLAQRYSCNEMRIVHWIIHNAIDGAVNWVNMGSNVGMATFMETYMKSARMCYQIVHQYDANARVYIPFTHGWTKAAGGGWYQVTDMLDMLNAYSRAEGDFFWAPACHSYPEQLTNPEVWNDKNATFSMKTEFVSLKNLEVLNKWVLDPANQYQGKEKRSAWLSETGTGTRIEPTEADLTKQAAGFAYGWKKINALEGIEGIQWHNWYDNPAEAVLLGLRYQENTGKPEAGQPKPVWHAYQQAGTSGEDAYFEQYLPVIGISDWNILQPVGE